MTDNKKPEQSPKIDMVRLESNLNVQQEYIGRLTHDLLVARTDSQVLKTKLADALDVIKVKEDLVTALTSNTEKLNAELTKKSSQIATNVFRHERMLNINRIAGSMIGEFLRSGARALNSDWLNPWDISSVTARRVKDYLNATNTTDASNALRFILKAFRINTEGAFKHVLNQTTLDTTPYAKEHVLFQVLTNFISMCDDTIREAEKAKLPEKQEQA